MIMCEVCDFLISVYIIVYGLSDMVLGLRLVLAFMLMIDEE